MKQGLRLPCMFLVVLMVLGLAACAGGGTPATPASTTAASTPGTAATPGTVAEPSEGYERVTITYATVQAREGYDYNNGDPFAAWWSEKFNYELVVSALGWDNWATQLSVWISSQDMPDVAVYDYKHPEASTFVEQGLLYRFPDDWKTRWPNTASVFAKTTLGPIIDELFGGTYFVTRSRFDTNLPGDPLPNHQSLHFRKDWAEAVGYPIKTMYTTPEMLEMAQLFKEQDPGGVGANLIPITGTPGNCIQMFMYANSTHFDTYYKDDDGVYKWGAASQDTLTGLKYYYQAYSSGLLDQEFFALNAEEDRAKFETTGVAGMLVDQLPTAEIPNRRIKFARDLGIDADAAEGFASVLGADGYYHRRDLINFWGAICFSPNVSDAVFERWMDVMDYASTEEGYASTVMGLWGVDFKQENGEYVSLLEPDVLLTGEPGESKYPSMGYILGSVKLWDDFAFVNPNIEKKYRDESWLLYTERAQTSTPKTFAAVDWDLYTFDSPNLRRAVVDYTNEYANLVTTATSEADLEAKWLAWIESQMPMIQPVLDELNAM